MRPVRRFVRLIRRAVVRADHAVVALVGKADRGIVGFVESVEHRAGRIVAAAGRGGRRFERAIVWTEHLAADKVVRVERSTVRKTIAAEKAVARPVRRAERKAVGKAGAAWRAVRTVVTQFVSEVAAVVAATFGAPGRLGRAVEALVAYWVTGTWRCLGRAVSKVTAPVRKRIAKRAKKQALAAATMTPDHKSHRELLVLAAVGVALVVGALVMFGKDWGVRQPGMIRFEAVVDFPGWAWNRLLALSPLKLTFLSAAVALAAAATVFWYRMLRDSYRRDYPTAVEQTQWRLVTTLLFVPGAVLYFFKRYNRLTVRKFAGRHVVSLMISGVAVLVATSTYGTLWYFNQQAQADVDGNGYQAPTIELDADERRKILSRDRYGEPLKPATSSRRDPFAPIPGEEVTSTPSPSPSPSPEA